MGLILDSRIPGESLKGTQTKILFGERYRSLRQFWGVYKSLVTFTEPKNFSRGKCLFNIKTTT